MINVFINRKIEDLPWVEKYRPNTLNDVKGHQWIVDALRNFAEQKKIPHMIFTGPAGTGKTSSAVALIHDLLGDNFTPDQILELNASDNVRMGTVTNEIKNFTNSISLQGRNAFKIIILDEADNIPKTPQQALRRIIEKSPPNVKFILMCNYENKLIDPILSRCALFRFTPLNKENVIARLQEIADLEKLKLADEFYEVLFELSQGDMRKAVNFLQMAAEMNIKTKKDYPMLYKVTGYLPPKNLDEITASLQKNNFEEARELLLQHQGFSGRNVLLQLKTWIESLDINTAIKSQIEEAIAEIDYRITIGSEINLQIESILGFITERLAAN